MSAALQDDHKFTGVYKPHIERVEPGIEPFVGKPALEIQQIVVDPRIAWPNITDTLDGTILATHGVEALPAPGSGCAPPRGALAGGLQ